MQRALAALGCDPLLTFRTKAVIEPSLDTIIKRLQLCIVEARALQLKMLEQILSIALLEALERKAEFDDDGEYPDD
jgi:hypothetical protein